MGWRPQNSAIFSCGMSIRALPTTPLQRGGATGATLSEPSPGPALSEVERVPRTWGCHPPLWTVHSSLPETHTNTTRRGHTERNSRGQALPAARYAVRKHRTRLVSVVFVSTQVNGFAGEPRVALLVRRDLSREGGIVPGVDTAGTGLQAEVVVECARDLVRAGRVHE
jgi:hypothetical protein